MERPFPAYEGTEPFIFVCYAHDDAGQVYPEITRLREAGFNVWYDEGISPGSEWSAELAARIQQCAVFLYFITPRSVEREHCRAELNFALDQRCTLLSVHLEPTNVPAALQLNLSHRQGILRYEHPSRAYESKLDRALEAAALGRSIESEELRGKVLNIGDWRLETGTQRLTDGQEERALELKEMSVLLHLAELAPEVVSTDALIERSWPGVVVGDNALHQVVGRLRRALGDSARNPRYIETLPKRGYRLMVPAKSATQVARSEAETSKTSEDQHPQWRRRRYRSLALFSVALVALAAGAWRFTSKSPDHWNPDFTPTPVALEPVTVIGSDPELEAYASVVELDMVVELTRNDLRLTGPGPAAEPDYLIGHTLRRIGEEVDVTLQVKNVTRSDLVWSKSKRVDVETQGFDHFPYAQQFAFLASVAIFLDGDLREQTTTLAKQEYIKGLMEWIQVPLGGDGDLGAAENYLRAAIAADPDYVTPHAQLGILYKNRLQGRIPYDKAAEIAYDSVERVLAKFPDWTFTLGTINSQLELDYAAAIANLEAQREFGCCNPPGEIESEIGWALLWSGDVDGALQRLNTAERMGPGTNQDAINWSRMIAYLATDRYAEAIAVADETAADLRNSSSLGISSNLHQVTAHYLAGNFDLAEQKLDRLWTLHGRTRPELFTGAMALLGRDAEARQLIDASELRFSSGELGVMSETFWAAYRLGDYELAYLWLDRTIENREYWFLPWFRHSKLLDPIRENPRFKAAMRRLEEIEATGTRFQSQSYP